MRAALAAVLVALVALPAAAADAKRLRAFSSCSGLVSYAQRHLDRTDGRPAQTVDALIAPSPPSRVPQEGTAVAPTAAPGDSAATPDFSTTNVQEEGVDEPDVAKTDGDTLFTVAGDTLYAVAVRGEPRIRGSLKLGGYGAQLLLRGRRLVVIEGSQQVYAFAARAFAPIPYGNPQTTLTEVDVSDPATMTVSRTLKIDGSFAAARQNGGTVRVVVNSVPKAYGDPETADRARGWLPRSHFASNVTGRRHSRTFVRCGAVARPRSFSGLGMLSIVTMDLDRGLWQTDADGVMTDAQTVYGSAKHLYVATQRWVDPRTPVADLPPGATTLISRFDVTDPDDTRYEGSGSVPGYLLNQFSMSEHEGDLRVASTSEPVWWDGAQQDSGQSQVTVLRRGAGGGLDRAGQVRGLGHGERIYSVRFIGDVGYVVTFRQIDPLYVVDLSNPESPKVRGELELLGYSAYLHPLGAGRLLGVGRDATPEGRTKGAQVSLFDVSDADHPKLLARRGLGDASSTDVEYDSHAFLYWKPAQLAVLPVQEYHEQGAPFAGAVGLRIGDEITEAGRVQHDPVDGYVPQISRALVVGDRLFTISEGGVLASDLGTFGRLSFVAFEQQASGGSAEPPGSSPPPGGQPARPIR